MGRGVFKISAGVSEMRTRKKPLTEPRRLLVPGTVKLPRRLDAFPLKIETPEMLSNEEIIDEEGRNERGRAKETLDDGHEPRGRSKVKLIFTVSPTEAAFNCPEIPFEIRFTQAFKMMSRMARE